MSDFKIRLETEKKELDEKISKLTPFIDSDNFKSIDPQQQELLTKQLPIMKSYSDILAERLSILT